VHTCYAFMLYIHIKYMVYNFQFCFPKIFFYELFCFPLCVVICLKVIRCYLWLFIVIWLKNQFCGKLCQSINALQIWANCGWTLMEVSFKAEWSKNLIRAMKCPSTWHFLPRVLSLWLCAIDIIRLENLIKGEQSNASFSTANKSGHMATVIHENPHPVGRPSRCLLEEQLKRPKLIS